MDLRLRTSSFCSILFNFHFVYCSSCVFFFTAFLLRAMRERDLMKRRRERKFAPTCWHFPTGRRASARLTPFGASRLWTNHKHPKMYFFGHPSQRELNMLDENVWPAWIFWHVRISICEVAAQDQYHSECVLTKRHVTKSRDSWRKSKSFLLTFA